MKYLSYIFIILLFAFNQTVKAQNFVFVQSSTSGGTAFESAKARCIDSENKHLIVGEFEGTVLFDSISIESLGHKDVFLAKYTENGTLLWVSSFGGNLDDRAEALITDSENNIYVAGSFRGTFKIEDTEITAENFSDNFLAKFNKDGELLFLKQIKTDTKGLDLVLTCDIADNIYLGGSFYSTLNIDTFEVVSESSSDIFISKFDKNGLCNELYSFGGFGKQELTDMNCDSTEILYLTGVFSRQINFSNEQFKSQGKQDIFIAKLENMQPIWFKQIGSYYADFSKKIIHKGQKLFLAGSFSGEVDFGGTLLNSQGVLDAFVASYDIDGNLIWASGFGGQANEYTNSLTVNYKGDAYLTGNFRGTVINGTDTLISENFGNDVFVAKFDTNGTYAHAMAFGGASHDYSSDILTDENLFIYQTGQFDNAIQFDSETNENGDKNDIFNIKYFDCDNAEKIELGDSIEICADDYLLSADSSFVTYAWNNGLSEHEIQITETGMYYLTCTDSLGCQSQDSVFVVINKLPEVILEPHYTTCDTEWTDLDAGEGFATYEWNTGSTEREITVNLAGLYSVLVTDGNGCQARAETELTVYPKPNPDLGKDKTTVKGETIRLSLNQTYASYEWSDFSEDSTLIIPTETMEVGEYHYSVEVSNDNGCSASDDIWINLIPQEEATRASVSPENETGLRVSKVLLTDNLNKETPDKKTKLTSTRNKIKMPVEELNIEFKADVFPNPSRGNFTVLIKNINTNENLIVQILSPNGQKIEEKQFLKSAKIHQQEFNMQNRAAGTYFLHVINGTQKLTKEIIIF